MRVVLVRPPRRHRRQPGQGVPPLGLAYVAAALREAGHDVAILDALGLRWSAARLDAALASRKPDAVGISVLTPTADMAARTVRSARSHARFVVAGGPHPTATGHAIFDEMPGLDAAVSGEGESTTPALLEWLTTGGTVPDGVLAPGHPFTPRPRERDLTALPSPARDLLPSGAYRYLLASRPRFATAITSRGCPFSCSFCDKSVGGSSWRARPAEHVADELERLVRDEGVGFVALFDDNLTLRRERVVDLCEALIARDLDLRWKCEGRVDGVDPALLGLMRRAGCDCIAYGVESANPATLRTLRKHAEPEQARRAFRATRQAGIRSLAYLILGVPGETAEDAHRTIDFAVDIGATYAQFSSLAAFPGTPLAHEATARGGHNPLDADGARATLTDLPPAELDRLQRHAWARFYLRPRPVARLARDAVRSGSLVEAARLAAGFARWAAWLAG